MSSLSEILLRAFGLNHELSTEPSPLSPGLVNALGRISNDPLEPIRSYWMLVLSGLPSLDLSNEKLKVPGRPNVQSFLTVNLESTASMVDLADVLYYSRPIADARYVHPPGGDTAAAGKNNTGPIHHAGRHRAHLSEILLRNAYDDSFLFYQSQSLPLLFSLIPETLAVVAPLPNYYCSSKAFLGALNGVLSSHQTNGANMFSGFGFSEHDAIFADPRARSMLQALFAEFRAIPELFDGFRNLSHSKMLDFPHHFYRSGGFNHYVWSTQVFQRLLDRAKRAADGNTGTDTSTAAHDSHSLAVRLLLNHFLPFTIGDMIDLYGANSLGMILLLDSTPAHTLSNSSRFHYSIQRLSAASSPDKSWAATTRDPNDTFGRDVPFCWPSEADCQKYSRHCYERGNCVSFNRSGAILANASDPALPLQAASDPDNSSNVSSDAPNKYVCWQCICDEPNMWVGSSCQYENWSANFFILLFVVLALLAILSLPILSLARLGASVSTNGSPGSSGTAGASNWVFKSAALTAAGHPGHTKLD